MFFLICLLVSRGILKVSRVCVLGTSLLPEEADTLNWLNLGSSCKFAAPRTKSGKAQIPSRTQL